MKENISEIAQYVYNNLSHGDFSMDELNKILEKDNIVLDNKQLGKLISELKMFGLTLDNSLEIYDKDNSEDYIPYDSAEYGEKSNYEQSLSEDELQLGGNVKTPISEEFVSQLSIKDAITDKEIDKFIKYIDIQPAELAKKVKNEILREVNANAKKKIELSKCSEFMRKCVNKYFAKINVKNNVIPKINEILKNRGIENTIGLEDYIIKKFNSNESLLLSYDSYSDFYKGQVEESLIDGYLAYLNYLYSLANVKVQDAKLNDMTANFLKVKESSKKEQQRFNDEYPVLNNVETQVKVQDANSTLAQASINTALKELGSNATSEEIKKRSLEILNDATLGKSK